MGSIKSYRQQRADVRAVAIAELAKLDQIIAEANAEREAIRQWLVRDEERWGSRLGNNQGHPACFGR